MTLVPFASHAVLFRAIERGDRAKLEEFLDAGMRVDQTAPEGLSLLMLATRSRKLGIMADLLARGAPVDQRNNDGETALMWAAMEKYPQGLEMLIEAGADIHAQAHDGMTALHWAVQAATDDEAHGCVIALVDAGVPVDTKNDQQAPILVDAAETRNWDLFGLLLGLGADINARGYCPFVDNDVSVLGHALIMHGLPTRDDQGEIIPDAPHDMRAVVERLLAAGAVDQEFHNGVLYSRLAEIRGMPDVAQHLKETSPLTQRPPALRLVR